jgi:hypothetical protein
MPGSVATMATIELTLEQIRNAILQLPDGQRRELLQDIGRLPSADEARSAARRVRRTFRMKPKQRKRMSELIAKSSDGTLSIEESRELDELVGEFERKTLEMAQSLARSGHAS